MAELKLYAGDVPDRPEYDGLLGLHLGQKDDRHIHCDIRERHPFDDNSVDSYQSEDVFEHIEYDLLPGIIADIYRILKPGGLFRLSVPDYDNPLMLARCNLQDGVIVLDREVPDHKWFPTVGLIKELFIGLDFKFRISKIVQCYMWVGRIDYSKGYVQRTLENDERGAISIVIDCIKWNS